MQYWQTVSEKGIFDSFCLPLKIIEFVQAVLKLGLVEVCNSIHVFQLIDVFSLLRDQISGKIFIMTFKFIFFFRKIFVKENRGSSVIRKSCLDQPVSSPVDIPEFIIFIAADMFPFSRDQKLFTESV